MFLLIAALIILAAIFYFVFINKKEMGFQNNALALMLKKMGVQNETESPTTQQLDNSTIELAEPTEADWTKIYSISEKIFNGKTLTKTEIKFQEKFAQYIKDDLEFCRQFYPLVEKMIQHATLNEEETEFYKANQEQVDAEVKHREDSKSQIPSSKFQKTAEENPKSEIQNPKLNGANPPMATQERRKLILSFFEDKIPLTAKAINNLLKEKTGRDNAKNIYRILGPLEHKFILPFKYKEIIHYGLPEWFDGKKLKQEFRNKIA